MTSFSESLGILNSLLESLESSVQGLAETAESTQSLEDRIVDFAKNDILAQKKISELKLVPDKSEEETKALEALEKRYTTVHEQSQQLRFSLSEEEKTKVDALLGSKVYGARLVSSLEPSEQGFLKLFGTFTDASVITGEEYVNLLDAIQNAKELDSQDPNRNVDKYFRWLLNSRGQSLDKALELITIPPDYEEKLVPIWLQYFKSGTIAAGSEDPLNGLSVSEFISLAKENAATRGTEAVLTQLKSVPFSELPDDLKMAINLILPNPLPDDYSIRPEQMKLIFQDIGPYYKSYLATKTASTPFSVAQNVGTMQIEVPDLVSLLETRIQYERDQYIASLSLQKKAEIYSNYLQELLTSLPEDQLRSFLEKGEDPNGLVKYAQTQYLEDISSNSFVPNALGQIVEDDYHNFPDLVKSFVVWVQSVNKTLVGLDPLAGTDVDLYLLENAKTLPSTKAA